MTRQFFRALALGTALTIGHSPLAFADIKDYEFQLIDKEVKEGGIHEVSPNMLISISKRSVLSADLS